MRSGARPAGIPGAGARKQRERGAEAAHPPLRSDPRGPQTPPMAKRRSSERPRAARPPQPDHHRGRAEAGRIPLVLLAAPRRSPVALPEGPATAAHQRAVLRALARRPLARAARGTRQGGVPWRVARGSSSASCSSPQGRARPTRDGGSPTCSCARRAPPLLPPKSARRRPRPTTPPLRPAKKPPEA